jgi:hypothetical protein
MSSRPAQIRRVDPTDFSASVVLSAWRRRKYKTEFMQYKTEFMLCAMV